MTMACLRSFRVPGVHWWYAFVAVVILARGVTASATEGLSDHQQQLWTSAQYAKYSEYDQSGPHVVEYKGLSNQPGFLYSPKFLGPRAVLFHSPSYNKPDVVTTFVEFASQVSVALRRPRAKEPVGVNMVFYTVSCDNHADLCANQSITLTPHIKLFRAGSKVEYPTTYMYVTRITKRFLDETLAVARITDYSFQGTTRQIMDYSDTEDEPDFLFYTPDTTPKVILFYSPVSGYAPWVKDYYVWLAGNITSGTAWEYCYAVYPSWTRPASQTSFHAVSCDAHPRLCARQKIERLPELRIYEAGDSTAKNHSSSLFPCHGDDEHSILCEFRHSMFRRSMCNTLKAIRTELPSDEANHTREFARVASGGRSYYVTSLLIFVVVIGLSFLALYKSRHHGGESAINFKELEVELEKLTAQASGPIDILPQ